jgi:DNA-binding MarR family transcriptional regulator/GNAT superfamily N-acetyltransferase
MTLSSELSVDRVRDSARKIVRELGFMNPTLAGTDFAPSAVHAIIEIGAHEEMTAVRLADRLNLEKSSVSRMLRKLIQAGVLREAISDADARAKILTLTARGRRTLARINKFGRLQVSSAFAILSTVERAAVEHGLATYARALGSARKGVSREFKTDAADIVIQCGYQAGVIGRAVEMHAGFYARVVGFGQVFESQVAVGFAEFISRLENPSNRLWVASHSDRIVGTLVIDGEQKEPHLAHLRWFIVDDGLRGAGIGNRLMSEAMSFCDRQRFATTQLWTFQGLDAARRLYERFGFSLEEESTGGRWGKEVLEQRFVRPLCLDARHLAPTVAAA